MVFLKDFFRKKMKTIITEGTKELTKLASKVLNEFIKMSQRMKQQTAIEMVNF